MEEKTLCPYYNVGYCKYKYKCLKEHAKTDCINKICKNKTCHKRHRKSCRYGDKCTYQSKNSCEFKHEPDPVKDQLEKVQEEASKVKTESETLKQQIKELQQTIQNQKKRLLEMNSEESKVKQLVSDIRDLETKRKGEKVMFEALLAKSTLCPRASEPLWLK